MKKPAAKKSATRKKAAPRARAATPAQRLTELEQLVEGQRRDFDRLATTLQGRDLVVDSGIDRAQAAAEGAINIMRRVVDHLNQTTVMVQLGVSAADRLAWHESRVPQMHAARKSYDAALKKKQTAEKKEREKRMALVAAHPELSEEGKAHVMSTGTLPSATEDPGDAAAGVGALLKPPPAPPLALVRDLDVDLPDGVPA